MDFGDVTDDSNVMKDNFVLGRLVLVAQSTLQAVSSFDICLLIPIDIDKSHYILN